MAGKVFVSVGMTLDGYIAPDGMDMAHAHDPSYNDWMAQWMSLQTWVFRQKFFRENLKVGDGGEMGVDNALLEETFRRTGVSVMGKRMFEGGERFWPEEAPFHTPVYVVTHETRAPWVRPGGTTFHFVNDGVESAVRQARRDAGSRDVRVAGGANLIVQTLNAGLVDELAIAVAPVVFGAGARLFDGVDRRRVQLELTESRSSSDVTHLRYRVSQPNGP